MARPLNLVVLSITVFLAGLPGVASAQVDDAPSLAGVIDIHAHVAPETSLLNYKRAFDAIEAAQIALSPIDDVRDAHRASRSPTGLPSPHDATNRDRRFHRPGAARRRTGLDVQDVRSTGHRCCGVHPGSAQGHRHQDCSHAPETSVSPWARRPCMNAGQ